MSYGAIYELLLSLSLGRMAALTLLGSRFLPTFCPGDSTELLPLPVSVPVVGRNEAGSVPRDVGRRQFQSSKQFSTMTVLVSGFDGQNPSGTLLFLLYYLFLSTADNGSQDTGYTIHEETGCCV
jgi:hypothetical protein